MNKWTSRMPSAIIITPSSSSSQRLQSPHLEAGWTHCASNQRMQVSEYSKKSPTRESKRGNQHEHTKQHRTGLLLIWKWNVILFSNFFAFSFVPYFGNKKWYDSLKYHVMIFNWISFKKLKVFFHVSPYPIIKVNTNIPFFGFPWPKPSEMRGERGIGEGTLKIKREDHCRCVKWSLIQISLILFAQEHLTNVVTNNVFHIPVVDHLQQGGLKGLLFWYIFYIYFFDCQKSSQYFLSMISFVTSLPLKGNQTPFECRMMTLGKIKK